MHGAVVTDTRVPVRHGVEALVVVERGAREPKSDLVSGHELDLVVGVDVVDGVTRRRSRDRVLADELPVVAALPPPHAWLPLLVGGAVVDPAADAAVARQLGAVDDHEAIGRVRHHAVLDGRHLDLADGAVRILSN